MSDLETRLRDLLIARADRSSPSVADPVPIIEAKIKRRRRTIQLATAVAAAVVVAAVAIGSMMLAPSKRTSPAGQPTFSPSAGGGSGGLRAPGALAIARDGSLLISDPGRNQILRLDSAGRLHVVGGTGTVGFSGDGGPASKAQINDPRGMAVASDGTIYFVDAGNNRIRAVTPTGTIRTIVGTGESGDPADGQAAGEAKLSGLNALAFDSAGQLYFTESSQIDRLTTSGIVRIVLSSQSANVLWPQPLSALAFSPIAMAFDSAGELYVANQSPKLVIERSTAGAISILGNDVYVSPSGLALGPRGEILVADNSFSLDQINGNQVTSLSDFSKQAITGVAGFVRPAGLAVASDGTVYVDDTGGAGGASAPTLIRKPSAGAAWLTVPIVP
jgi:sugar lactone lactonase YvrE